MIEKDSKNDFTAEELRKVEFLFKIKTLPFYGFLIPLVCSILNLFFPVWFPQHSPINVFINIVMISSILIYCYADFRCATYYRCKIKR